MKKSVLTLGLLFVALGFSLSAFRLPAGFEGSNARLMQPENTTDSLHRLSQQIVKEGFQLLGANLKQAIEKGGVPYALSFCNTKALPLTDSVAKKYHIQMSRVSDRNRNPENAANETELALMDIFRNRLAVNRNISDMVIYADDGSATYYAPIKIGAPCLQCHGIPETNITKENFDIIQKLYPADKAIGYEAGELRGLWVLRFEK